MFINSSQLKKLMKHDYKDHQLVIGNLDDGISIVGSTWAVHILNKFVPNIVKSIVIELAGILPEAGDIFTISKKNPNPQYEADTGEGRSLHLLRRYRAAKISAFQTNIFEEEHRELFGLVQSNREGKLVHIRKELLDLIDLEAINGDFEDMPGNPCYGHEMNEGLIWHNATTTLLLLPAYCKDSKIIKPLEKLPFNPTLSSFTEVTNHEE